MRSLAGACPEAAAKISSRLRHDYSLSQGVLFTASNITSGMRCGSLLSRPGLTSLCTKLAINVARPLQVISSAEPQRAATQRSKSTAVSAMSHYKNVVLGGGQAAGYAAREFVAQGVQKGELAIIGDEKVVAYERPALSKAYLAPEKPARLPGFHTCVGGGGEKQEPSWYSDKGITYKTGTSVKAVSLKDKKLTLADDDTVSYDNLIIATGAKPISLAGKVPGSDLQGIYYLRNVEDADRLVTAINDTKAKNGKAVVVGGGYIGMEVTSGLVSNGISTTIVLPEPHLMSRLFTPELAQFYEKAYTGKGVTLKKGAKAEGFEGADGKVTNVLVDVGGEKIKIPADLVVIGIGARPNIELFQDQLTIEQGGIKVDERLQTSVPGVYAVGDVALFPLKLYGNTPTRTEHVINARQTAAHAVKAIYGATEPFDYLPSFYSRVFNLSWVFYGKNEGEAVHFGDQATGKFGAYWVQGDKVVGGFLEGGSPEEAAAVQKLARAMPPVPGSSADLAKLALEFAVKL